MWLEVGWVEGTGLSIRLRQGDSKNKRERWRVGNRAGRVQLCGGEREGCFGDDVGRQTWGKKKGSREEALQAGTVGKGISNEQCVGVKWCHGKKVLVVWYLGTYLGTIEWWLSGL